MPPTTLRKDPNTRLGATYDFLKPCALAGTARTANVTAIGSKADEYAEPATILTPSSTASDRYVFSPCGARQVGLAFMIVGADGTGGSATIWGWQGIEWGGKMSSTDPTPAPYKYVARPLLTITFVGGTRTVANLKPDPLSLANSGLTWRYCDTVAIVADYTFGGTAAAVLGSGLDGWPLLAFDPTSQPLIEIEPDNTDSTQILPFWVAM